MRRPTYGEVLCAHLGGTASLVAIAALSLLSLTACGSGGAPKAQAVAASTPLTTRAAIPSPTPSARPGAPPKPPRRSRPAGPPLRVELWGDSMGMQSAPAFSFLLGLSGNAVTANHTFPGTAICDWLADIRSEVDPANPAGFHPQAAVFVFSGISYTPCSRGADGRQLTGRALLDKYRADAAQAIALFAKANVPVYFASVPISRDNAAAGAVGDTLIGDMYARLPARYPVGAGQIVRFIDSALAVEWHGHYTDTLPCEKGETCTGRWPDGTPTVVVREADGRHFCPVAEVPSADGFGFMSCPVVMPGALRFMGAITTKVLHDFDLK